MKRREFIHKSVLTAGMTTLLHSSGLAALLNQPAYKMLLLRNDVGVFTQQGGTIGWLINDAGIVVVDSQFPEPAANLISELRKKADKPFRYLINTHHHGDHTGGNIAFKGLAEHVVAHSNSLINQRRVAADQKSEAKQLFPDTVFNRQWKTSVGDHKIRAQYFGAAHTNGDIVVHFEDANIAHLGDLMFNKRYPFIDRTAGANIQHWIKVLDKILKKFDSDTLFIFGHASDPDKITGGKEEIRRMQNYLERLLTLVSAEIRAGKSKEEILKITSIPGAEDYQGQGIERSLTAAYEELTSSKK